MGLFAEAITEKQFFEDLKKAKIVVDGGIKDWFIYAFPSATKNVESPKNTLIKDLVSVFGIEFVCFMRFAALIDCGNNGATHDEYQSIQIRPITNNDKKKLSSDYRFFPKDTWVCDWRAGDGSRLVLPFIQDENTAEIKWLSFDNLYRKYPVKATELTFYSMPTAYLPDMLNIMPDYWDMQLVKYTYKDVDILIPIAKDTGKVTFKNRDKDEFGVKRHIVHSVKAHNRINSDKEVYRHLRGRSDITINGIDVCIMGAYEFSYEYFEKQKGKKQKKSKKRKPPM